MLYTVPSSKLRCQWSIPNIPVFNRKYIFKWSSFQPAMLVYGRYTNPHPSLWCFNLHIHHSPIIRNLSFWFRKPSSNGEGDGTRMGKTGYPPGMTVWIPSGKLAWQWRMDPFEDVFPIETRDIGIFHWHLSLLEGTCFYPISSTGQNYLDDLSTVSNTTIKSNAPSLQLALQKRNIL